MMALAITAVAGVASAGSCGDDCAFGYRLKVMVRTTASCDVIKKGECSSCSTATYRGPVIRRFMGLVYGVTKADSSGDCGEKGCACNTWKNNAYVAFFDYDNTVPMTLNAGKTELIQLNRIGCKAADRDKAEMAFTVGFACKKNVAQMTFAGFGLCGNHNGKITLGAVSGYCAGRLPAGATTYNAATCKDVTSCGNRVWNLCCNADFECFYTAAYGKWTLVWDSSIADKYGSNLDSKTASTKWGDAKAVKLADKRECNEKGKCSTCTDPITK